MTRRVVVAPFVNVVVVRAVAVAAAVVLLCSCCVRPAASFTLVGDEFVAPSQSLLTYAISDKTGTFENNRCGLIYINGKAYHTLRDGYFCAAHGVYSTTACLWTNKRFDNGTYPRGELTVTFDFGAVVAMGRSP